MIVATVAIVAVSACSSSDKASKGPTVTTSSPTTATGKASEWSPSALAAAKTLADTARAKGVQCDGYAPQDYAAVSADLQKSGIPVPGAMASCTSAGGEDLTFETFADQAAAYAYMGTKIARVCKSAGDKPELGAFPYVRALTWFVEPDNQATADKLAPLLGGITTTAHCTT
jgi:hypothetical protein